MYLNVVKCAKMLLRFLSLHFGRTFVCRMPHRAWFVITIQFECCNELIVIQCACFYFSFLSLHFRMNKMQTQKRVASPHFTSNVFQWYCYATQFWERLLLLFFGVFLHCLLPPLHIEISPIWFRKFRKTRKVLNGAGVGVGVSTW